MKRLKLVAEAIGAPVPSAEALRRLAGALSGFPESVIDSACYRLEDAPQGDFRRLPTPHELKAACEEAAQARTPENTSRWCGRCVMGSIRGSDGEIRNCECNCTDCGNSGFALQKRIVKGYKAAISFAMLCPNGCRKAGTFEQSNPAA